MVATDLPEIRRIVRAYDIGLLVRDRDDAALSAALNQLSSDPQLRKALAQNASLAAAQLNWEQQEDQLLNLYQTVLERGHSARLP